MSRGPARVSGSEEHVERERDAQVNTSGTDSMDQEADGPGLFGRYVRVFISPDSLFQGLRRRPVWLGAMLLGGCLALIGTALIPPELAIATLRERMLERGQPAPPGFGDQLRAFRFVLPAVAFVSWALVLTIFAGLVTLFFAFLMGHEGTFRQYLAVVAHAHLILATSTVLVLPLRIAAEDAQLLLSLGAFAVFLEPGYMLRFLRFLDLFGLWAWILVGLGVARIGRKESWAGAAVIVMIIPVTMAAVVAIFTG